MRIWAILIKVRQLVLGSVSSYKSIFPKELMSRCPNPSDIPLTSENAERDDSEGLIKITIMDGGHLRLVDSSNHTFFFSSDELRQRNIDANALTDENLHDIIQDIMPQLLRARLIILSDDKSTNGESAPKRRRQGVESLERESYYTAHYYQGAPHGYQQSSSSSVHYHSSYKSASGGGGYGGYHNSQSHSSQNNGAPQSSLHAPKVLTSTNFSHFRAVSASGVPPVTESQREISDVGIGGLGRVMIGEEMEVKNAEGRIEMAIVRYYRPGTGYKIQFADGHFEWLEENSVLEMKHQQSSGHTYTKPQPSSISSKSTLQRISLGHGSHGGPSSLNSSGGGTSLRRVGLSQHQSYHSTLNSSASTSTDTVINIDENINGGHRSGGHHSSSYSHHHGQHSGYYRNSGSHYQPPHRQSHQSAYRDNVLPPNVTGMRVSVSDDAAYHEYQTNRHDHSYQNAQNIEDDEIIELDSPYRSQQRHHPQSASSEYVNVGGAANTSYPPGTSGTFFCAICDRYHSRNNLSFLVVRIPACYDCAHAKVAVIDDENELPERKESVTEAPAQNEQSSSNDAPTENVTEATTAGNPPQSSSHEDVMAAAAVVPLQSPTDFNSHAENTLHLDNDYALTDQQLINEVNPLSNEEDVDDSISHDKQTTVGVIYNGGENSACVVAQHSEREREGSDEPPQLHAPLQPPEIFLETSTSSSPLHAEETNGSNHSDTNSHHFELKSEEA